MPTLSEMNEHANDAEHQAFQRAYDALLDIAKDPITCRHFWDVGRLDYARETEQELAIAYIDGHARGRESLRIELERQEAKAQPPDVRELVEALRGLIAHHEGRDDYGTDFQYWKRARAALAKFGGGE
jgi:hypothetical protein